MQPNFIHKISRNYLTQNISWLTDIRKNGSIFGGHEIFDHSKNSTVNDYVS